MSVVTDVADSIVAELNAATLSISISSSDAGHARQCARHAHSI